VIIQAFRHIFTSPSSASGKNISEADITSRRHDVAAMLGLNGQVTSQSIAYTTTQVCQLLPTPFFIFSDAPLSSLSSLSTVHGSGSIRMLAFITPLFMILLWTSLSTTTTSTSQ
jgi:hypothetical protein